MGLGAISVEELELLFLRLGHLFMLESRDRPNSKYTKLLGLVSCLLLINIRSEIREEM